MPRISVLMPAYNAERYVRDAIGSVLAQTFTDFEFIIVDDGSRDQTLQILESYAACDARIRILRNEKNLGLIGTLNKGLDAATGALIARIDADDLCRADRFACQVAFLDSHPDHILVGASYRAIDESGRDLWDKITGFDDAQLRWVARFRTPLGHSGAMFRARDASGQPWRYDPRYEAREDYDLWLRMLDMGRAAVLPEPLFAYRIHNETITGTKSKIMAENGLALALRNARSALPHRMQSDFAEFLRAYLTCEKVSRESIVRGAAVFDDMLEADIAAFPRHRIWFRKQAAGVLAEGLLAKGGAAQDAALLRTFLVSTRHHLPWLALRAIEDKGVTLAFWKRRAQR